MSAPRFKLIKELLSEDGLLFISIDDHEYHNLKAITDDIFGEDNYVATLVWNTDGPTDNQYHVKINHEYVLVYSANNARVDEAIAFVVDPNTRKESNLWKGFAQNSITKNGPGNPPSEVLLPIGFPAQIDKKTLLPACAIPSTFFKEVRSLKFISRDMTKQYELTYPIRFNEMLLDKGALARECRVYSGWANVNKLKKFIETGFKPVEDKDGQITFYLSEKGVIYYRKEREKARNILSVLRSFGTTEQMKYELEKLGVKFDYPKPIQLIKYLIEIGSNEGDTILDSFAGSGTTGNAVMELNKEGNGCRKFILVQMTEKTPDQPNKNVCKSITRQRLKQALEKNRYDVGFEYLRVGTPIDSDSLLSGKLPTYKQFAKHVFYLCTGENLPMERDL